MVALRRTGTTSAATLSGLIAAVGLTHLVAPDWSRRVGLDVWNFAEENECLRRTSEESARLTVEAEKLRESIETSEHVTTRLIAGDLTLAGATEFLEPLLRKRHGFRLVAEAAHPGVPFRMLVARDLINRVQRQRQINPLRLAALNTRLEAEFRAMR